MAINLSNNSISKAYLGVKHVVSAYIGEIELYFHPERSYLTFEAAENGCVAKFYCSQDNSEYFKTIEVSRDEQIWESKTSANADGGVILATLNKGEKLYVRGDNSAYASYTNTTLTYANSFHFSKKTYVYGNVMSLINSKTFRTLTSLTSSYTFAWLFFVYNAEIANESNVISHRFKDIALPSMNATNRCYTNMFRKTGITKAPKLPATSISAYCYTNMFMDCANLSKAPSKLPATAIPTYCYTNMFRNCISLEYGPDKLMGSIQNNTSNYCYQYMFAGCTSLKKTPQLPTSGGAPYCCFHMFENCSSLTTISNTKLSTETYQEYYSFMFANCTSLKEAPELPAGWGASDCYKSMFEGCTSLIKIPSKILVGDLQQQGGTCSNMFNGCTSLKTANIVIGTWPNDGSYNYMFSGCVSLESVSDLGTFNHGGGSFQNMFSGCTHITKAPKFILNSIGQAPPCSNMFYNCTSLVDISEIKLNVKNLSTNTAGNTYGGMFYGCTALTHVPKDFLPAITLASSCYNSMFYGCTSLVDAPDLPALQMAASCYQMMFQSCASLKKAPDLPATGLSSNCYQNMFNMCACLSEAPKILPATNINAPGCYNMMFRQCTTLKKAPILPAKSIGSVSNAYRQMFEGCSNLEYVECYATSGINTNNSTTNWLSGVKSTGNFYKDDYATWPRSISGIPTNWNVNNNNCITFAARESNCEISLVNLSSEQYLEYSYDKTTWNELNTNTIITLTDIDDKVYVHGTLSGNNTTSNYTQFSISGQVACYGNINALWDMDTLSNILFEYCGYRLFYACADLVSAPSLPSTTLSVGAYREMFSGCTSLKVTPDLPATTLNENCYDNMFAGCSSLIQIPDMLPATTLASYCYQSMFKNCTALKRIQNPKNFLPCTNLSGGSNKPYPYAEMFMGCTSLVNAPELSHVTTAMHWAYYRMFYGCTSLVEPPTQIKAVFNQSCQEMFRGCTSLKKTPILSATNASDNCYQYMFYGCNSLETAPELPATTLGGNCYLGMFQNCSNLKFGPSILPTITLAGGCYQQMFQGCSKLEVAPKISATTISDQSCRYMFLGCSKLKYPPALPATTFTGQWGYREMFYGCTSLCEMPDLPATNLGYGCYSMMFYGCTNLRVAKPLPATTLTTYAYHAMFKNCTNLNHIEIAATDISASNCLLEWVQGVQTTKGTFVKDPNITIPTGINGIPSNWAVLNNDTINSKSLKFRSGQNGSTIGLEKLSSNQTIYYSTSYNTNDWTQMTTSTTITLNNNEELYIRGNLSVNNTTSNFTQFKMTGIIYAGGDLRYLWNSNKNAALKQYCGWKLFKDCTALYSTPYLEATTMVYGCYGSMFNGCTNLTIMPLLPATALANYCYGYMFNGCTNIIVASDLPATSLAQECYKDMFNGCTSLTIPPRIYATGSANNCCYEMFKGCTSLVNPPELLFTNLKSPYATGQFTNMFEGCTSLVSAPSLKPKELTNSCYARMFKGCASLINIPLLTITTIAQSCESMFQDCTSLTDISNIKLPSTTAIFCYDSMFYGCTLLKKVPKDFLPATSLTGFCYRSMFQNCTNLEETPDLPATTLANACYYAMFQNCSKLTYAPKLSAKVLMPNCYFGMFYGCANLNHIEMSATDISATDCLSLFTYNVQTGGGTFIKDPSTTISRGVNGIPANWAVVENDRWVKFKSTSISTIALNKKGSNHTLEYSLNGSTWNIFDTTTTAISLSNNQEIYIRGILSAANTSSDFTQFKMTGQLRAFGNCNNLWDYTAEDIIDLPLHGYAGYAMFANCQALFKAPDLPTKSLSSFCYQNMFAGTSITKTPELPAPRLPQYCYEGMFSRCASLSEASDLMAVSYSNCIYQNMFLNCTSLTKAPKMNFAKLVYGCYSQMFQGCTSLSEVYDELPATVGQGFCYNGMFSGCTSLVKASNVGLVTAQQYCCERMFSGCTSLTEFPQIDIRILNGDYCCTNMFSGCTNITGTVVLKGYKLAKGSYAYIFNHCVNLNDVVCLANDISATEGLDHWLNDVAATGTLTIRAGMSYPSGVSGVPSGWTTKNQYDY